MVGSTRSKQAIRVIRSVGDTQRDPFSGLGKPEPRKHELAGCWSRRIEQEQRSAASFSFGEVTPNCVPGSTCTGPWACEAKD